jgi:hypothetical protein
LDTEREVDNMRKRGRPSSSDAARRRARVCRLAAEIVRARNEDVAKIAKRLDVDERTVRADLTAIEATPDPVAPGGPAVDLAKNLENAKTGEEISRVEKSIGVELAAGRLPLAYARLLLEVCRRERRKPNAMDEESSDDDFLGQAVKDCEADINEWPRDRSNLNKKKAELESGDESGDDPPAK